MKKILFLSPLPPPLYGSATSSKMCLEILKKSKKIEVHSIKLNYSRDFEDIGRINIDKIKGIFEVKKRIRDEIKKFRPDEIYFVPATYSFGLIRDWIFVKEIKKHWDKKILFHIRSRILDKTWENLFGRRILKEIYEGNKAIVLGRELIGDLRGMIPAKDIYILPNAIQNKVSDKELTKIINKRSKNKQMKILFLSNLDKTKGWMELLDACKIMNKKRTQFKCNIIGKWLNNKDKKYFHKFIRKNKLEKRVFSHGEKKNKKKDNFLKAANVLVFPTKRDTFGKVIIEAYMFGVPVIGSREGSIPSIIDDGKTGFLLKTNSGAEIAKKIIYHNNWKKLGMAGRKKFLKEFELEKYKVSFLNFFK